MLFYSIHPWHACLSNEKKKKKAFHQNVKTFFLAGSPSPPFYLIFFFISFKPSSSTTHFRNVSHYRKKNKKKTGCEHSFTLTSEGILWIMMLSLISSRHVQQSWYLRALGHKSTLTYLGPAPLTHHLLWLPPWYCVCMNILMLCLFSSEECMVYN